MSAVASGHKYTKIALTFQNFDVIYSCYLYLGTTLYILNATETLVS